MSLSREEFEKVYDFIQTIGGKGSAVQSIYEQLRGINSIGTHPSMPANREQFGMTFFTRPRMNLNDANLRAWEPFYAMIGGEGSINIPRAVRALLDPVGVWRSSKGSLLIDNEQAFIPWLSNMLVSQSGWPDISPGTWTSNEGNHHEARSQIDDTIKNYRVWDLNTTLRNGAGNSILMLLYVWVCYPSLIYEGDMTPFIDAIIQTRIDSHTRIFRFSMDANKRRISSWWSTIAYPYVAPTATGANFSMDSPFNQEGQQLSVNWKCHGCDTFHPIVLSEFNNTVAYFNPKMHPSIRDKYMVEIKEDEWGVFNYKTFFSIDTEEQTMHRWVDKDIYADWTTNKSLTMGQRFTSSTIPVSYGGHLDGTTTAVASTATPTTGTTT
jgi:hypothetical protein